jgi:dipeptidyl aminopeptidase/acylaminoacyl peptidase
MSRKAVYRQFASTRLYYTVVAYSPDGKHIAHIHNATGQFNAWTVPSGGGYPRQLTSYTDNRIEQLSWSPDGKSLLLQADQNADEQHQVYLVGANGGWPEALTQKMDSQHNFAADAWSPDGRTIAYCANDVEPANMDIILRDMQTGELRRPVPSGGLFFPNAWSPDGRCLQIVNYKSNTDQDVMLVELASGEVINATPHDGEIIFLPGPWSPDSRGFYLVTNQGREFSGLAFYEIASRSWQWVETPDYDIEQLALSRNGRTLIWSVNEDGTSKLYGRDLQTGAALNLPDLPLGVISAMDVSPDGKRVGLILSRPTAAGCLYELDLETGDLQMLGQSMLGGIDPAEMVEPELIRYPTFDGRMIPAWLYRPRGAQGRVPVMLSIHGGPEAQERPGYAYNGLYQYLLSRGLGILAPNIRGSTGYGISYQKLIHRDWGGAELKDIEYAAKYLRSLDWVDSNRLAVFGGSFGGFATLSAVSRLPEYWAVGVDIVGPANLLTFVNSVPPFWKRFMKQWVGDAEEDRALLVERSPITYVDQIRAPMLVIQGANDPRVVQAESDQMVERIRARGGEVTYYVDPQEGHGATRRENSLKWMNMVSDFLEKHLLDEPASD